MVKDEKEKNPILNPQAEGSNAGSESRKIENEIIVGDYLFSTELPLITFSKLYEKRQEKLNEIIEMLDKIERGEASEKETEETEKEIQKISKELKISKISITKNRGGNEDELSVITTGGTEVIKAEISQKLIEAKELFEKFEISEASELEIKNKVKKKLNNLTERGIIYASVYGFMSGTARQKEREKKEAEAREELEKAVKKLVKNTIGDLETHRKKIVKKTNKIIEARNKEVFEAKDAIAKFESVIEGLKERNKHQKNKSDREISKLQEEIGKLLNTIKEKENELGTFKEKEKNAINFLKKQREAELKKLMDGQNSVNPPIQDDQKTIKQLKEFIQKLQLEIQVLEDSKDQREKEIQHAKNEIEREKERHETTKNNAKKELDEEKAEHATTRNTWQNTYNRLKNEKDRIEIDRDRISQEKEDLEKKLAEINEKTIKPLNEKINQLEQTDAENRELIGKKNRELTQKDERIKELEDFNKPSLLYKVADKLGVVKMKQTMTNIFILGMTAGFIYATSLVWKYWIKPAYRNFKGEPKRKGKVRYDDYEEVEESEEKQPTIIIQNSTTAEKTDQQEKKKNKKKVKGDSS